MLLASVCGHGRRMIAIFAVLHTCQAFLFYFLKTLDRVHAPAGGLIYTPVFYSNLALKDSHFLRFLSDEHRGLYEISRVAILVLVPVLGWTAWRLLDRYLYPTPQPR